jgi:hypothetical protein
VEDLGSTNSTTVNGRAIGERTVLRGGDTVTFGRVVVRVDEIGRRDFTVGDQVAKTINNVDGDQYQYYIRQRESFLREIAATRTKARRLVWFGASLFVMGLFAFAVSLLRFMSRLGDGVNSDKVDVLTDDSPWSINGFPLGLIGWAVALVGVLLIVIGTVLHVVATARRRRVDQTLPVVPPPWASYGRPTEQTPTYGTY